MRSVLVTISGPSRSGKDTFISHVKDALTVQHSIGAAHGYLSSIDAVKKFTAEMGAILQKPHAERYPDEPTQVQRQMWADIKAALDRGMNWTVNLAMRHVGDPANPEILIYQVREPQNLEYLRDQCKERDVAMVSVFLRNAFSDPRSSARATTDYYSPADILACDIVVNNTDLQTLQWWGDFLALHIAKHYNS